MKPRISHQSVCPSWLSDGSPATRIVSWSLGILPLALTAVAAAADLDTHKLPAAAAIQVDYDRDIRPIFEQSCLRCHGLEKPKSHFRLTSRGTALKGGDNNTDDIIPGDGGRSRLIQYVAGMVADTPMPPPGKAQPLTSAQVGLLRAWIDQGAAWTAANPFPQSSVSVSPGLRWVGVHGDTSKFREVEGIKPGWGGGLEHFILEGQDTPDTKLSVEGKVLAPEDDLELKLNWTKTDGGFMRAGFDRWRKYYDDTGGFAPSLPTHSFSLNRDLFLDHGRAWFDFGLALPNRPQIVLGYEYQFKQGDEATLQWGAAGTSGATTNNIVPAAKHIDEHTHILKLDVSHEIGGWRLEDNARVEFYHLETSRTNGWPDLSPLFASAPDTIASVAETERHTQGANTFSVNKQLTDWLSVSSGYLYSRLDGSASVNQNTLDSSGNPVIGDQWSAGDVSLKRESQVVSFGSLMGPWNGLFLSAGIQGEWTHQESSGLESSLFGTPASPDPANSAMTNATGRYDVASARENFSLRYTGIPWTVAFAEARLRQESFQRFEEGFLESPTLTSQLLTNTTDADIESEEYRVGFNTSPWQRLSLGANFKQSFKHTGYSSTNTVLGAYPGFLQWRDIDENQVEARLVYRATGWLKTSFSFQWRKTDFDSATVVIPGFTGGSIEGGVEQAHVYSVNAVLTPFRRLYWSSLFTYSDTRTTTAFDGTAGVVPWQGHVYSVLSSATFALNRKTDLKATALFSRSVYGQNNQSSGLPLGVNYEREGFQVGVTRRFPKNLVATVAYGFSRYHEPTSGDVNDFTANTVFTSLTIPWP